MGYSVKWVVENLGITRDMLRYYEKEKLLVRENRNKTNAYRDYSDEDIERIWGIRLLVGIGFSAKEIYSLMNDPGFDFETAILKKIEELERKRDEDVLFLEYAKSIKLIGRIPTVKKVGSVCFDEFLVFARDNWNLYANPRSSPFAKAADTIMSKEPREWNDNDLENLRELFGLLGVEGIQFSFALNGYCQVIADMKDLSCDCDMVQRVVRSLHQFWISHNDIPELDGKITPQFMADYLAPSFVSGDVAKNNEKLYGKDGCQFIAKAIAFYGGYDISEL